MIPEHKDAFGAGLKTYLSSGEYIELVERDNGYIKTNDGVSGYFAPYEQWHVSHQKALQYNYGHVLGVGCGADRVALYLKSKGHDVVSIRKMSVAKLMRCNGLDVGCTDSPDEKPPDIRSCWGVCPIGQVSG